MTISLTERFLNTRARTEQLAAPLSDEDQVLQSMPSASPTKWHRAHTTWFFETFVLLPAGHTPIHPSYSFLFNSYYDAVGDRVARPKRGMLSRPSGAEVALYRQKIDARMLELLEKGELAPEVEEVVVIGLNHEEQHQELILTDILNAFSENPVGPAYREADLPPAASPTSPLSWTHFQAGLVEIGVASPGFHFDNEGPRHQVFLRPYELATRPISVGEVKAFIAEGGYHRPSLWLSDGYGLACAEGWESPLYSRVRGGSFEQFSLRGWRVPSDDEAAAHLSFWEAEALARFLGGRLPTESEWEFAASGLDPNAGNFADGALVPSAPKDEGLSELFGNVWEWTRSSYEPYPGYHAAEGAIGEYNGKFMAQQMVLRGGSCFTPRGHMRKSYRNFWPPETRFQMSGARLARDA